MPKITKQIVDNAKAPESGDLWIWDTDLQGFGVRVQPSGRKTYTLRYRTKDEKRTQRKMVICRCSDAPPEKARNLARDVLLQVAAGGDPAGDRRPDRSNTVTVEALFKAHIANMRAKGKASADEVERMLLVCKDNAADALGRHRHPSEVEPIDVVKYVSRFYQAGHRGAADKARGYVAAAYSFGIKSANDYTVAVRQDWGIKSNPAAAVAKDHGAIKVRDRNLSAEEIKVVWEACLEGNGGFSEGIEVCLRTIIACGQRVQETLRLEGSELDLDKAVWKMPAHKTKGKKRDHMIPLPAIIIPDLRKLVEKHGDGPLFKARTGSTQEVIGSISVAHAVRRWLTTEGVDIEAFQPRDLRRTWKSRTHDAGIDRFTRDLIQQHAKNDTGSKNYDRADYFPQMREAMDKWNAWLSSVVKPKPALTLVA